MAPMIDPEAIATSVRDALPDAPPVASVRMLKAQVPHLDARAGAELVARLTEVIDPAAWRFTDAELDRWPAAAAAYALTRVRALAPGTARIEALCNLARRLTREEQREALDGLLDNTLPSVSYEYTKPLSNSAAIEHLVRALPEEWQEEWIAAEAHDESGRADVFRELIARRAVDRLTDAALRRLWSPAAGARRDDALLFFAARLPTELKEAALATIRASDESTRLLHLARFDAELTDAERRELVETPWNVYTRDTPRCQAEHLERVAAHLPKVPAALRERWLEIVLRFQDDYDLQRGLVALLPALAGEGRRRAADALVRSVIREGRFYTIEQPWELLPDDAFGPLLRRLQDDAYGWSRAAIIAHLIDARAPALVDRCMQPLLDALPEREPDHRVELVDAMTPWLADRSGGAVPRALAAMSVPPSSQAVNPLYAIQRVLGRRRRELENPG